MTHESYSQTIATETTIIDEEKGYTDNQIGDMALTLHDHWDGDPKPLEVDVPRYAKDKLDADWCAVSGKNYIGLRAATVELLEVNHTMVVRAIRDRS